MNFEKIGKIFAYVVITLMAVLFILLMMWAIVAVARNI